MFSSACQIKSLTKRCREIIELKLDDTQCGFRPSRSTTDQIFTLQQSFDKSLEYAKDVETCFVDLGEEHKIGSFVKSFS